MRAIHEYWGQLRGSRFAPAWPEVDMLRFPPKLLPTTMIVDIHEPIENSLFRYWGSKLTEIHGRDMTGKCPYTLKPLEFGQKLLADHRELVEKKIPLAWHYSFLAAKGFIHSHSVLRLPLSDDGQSVRNIIIIVDFSHEAMELMRRKQETYDAIVLQE